MALAALAVMCAPVLPAQQDSSDARVIIHVDSLDRAAFSNVAELLQARLPGLHVARTGDGGLRWFMRGPSSLAESHPMVLVDGVRINVAGSTLSEMGTRPPVLDEIDIESVDRIEIWSGAATSARFGTGAGNGVIRVVTLRPRLGPTSFRITAGASALDEHVDYPANFNRPGLDTAGRGVRCTLQNEALELCTPTGPLTSINPLESDSPFETGFGGRVAASLTAGTERVSWRAATTFDHQGSTAGALANQRLHLQGAAALRPIRSANVDLNGFLMRGDADLPAPGALRPSLLQQGLLARADVVWPGFVRPSVAVYNAMRYGGTLNGAWRPRPWLDARVTSGVVRMSDESDLEYGLDFVPQPSRQVNERGERRRRDWNARIEGEARFGAGAIRHATALVIEHAVTKGEEEHGAVISVPGGGSSASAFWFHRRLAIAGVGLEHRLRFREWATVTGGARLEQARVNDRRLDAPVARYVSLSWDGSPLGSYDWGRVRLRAALGDVANVPQTMGTVLSVGIEQERPKAEFTREREIGLDATLLHDRLTLSGTWYTKRTSNVGAVTQGFDPAFPRFQRIEVLNRGVEAIVHGRFIQRPGLGWDVTASYAYNHNETRRGTSSLLFLEYDPFDQQSFFARQWIAEGLPLGAHRSHAIMTLQDLDGDGRPDDGCFEDAAPCEVVVSRSADFYPAFPPRSLSVSTAFRFRNLTFRALLDHRAGHFINNTTMEQRCLRECQARFDPSTSFREQAEVILTDGSGRFLTVQDASYTKLREISVRLTAPPSWARSLGASRLDLSLAARNIATWSDYRGLDPETTSLHWIPVANEDSAAEPLPRRFSIRITATK